MTGTVVDVDELLAQLGCEAPDERDEGGYWVFRTDLDVRAMAVLMHDREVRLVTITALPEAPEEPEEPEAPEEPEDSSYRLIYHWDVAQTLLNLATTVTTQSGAPTITDLIPGADWAEREIRDYYDVDFTGRRQTPTLMLREGDPAGLFTRTHDVGRDADPAVTARRAAEAGESK